jgi:hypothetical protein
VIAAEIAPNQSTIGSFNMSQVVKTEDDLKTGKEQKLPEEPKKDVKPKKDEELRTSPRLQCSGTAGIQMLPIIDDPTPAKILNLSIGGCLMELERPLTVAIDDTAELIFCVNNWPFRVRGKVRAIRSEKLIGFQFPQLNDRIKRQLEDLIGEMIAHLTKLHKQSIAYRTFQDDVKQPQAPVVPPVRGASPLHPGKPVADRQGNLAGRAEPTRRWF